MTDEIRHPAPLVTQLLREQHPELAELPVREVAGGYDNQMFRLGDDLAVRLPRSDSAAGLTLREQRWLPTLAPRLPLPVPDVTHRGVPSLALGHPWSVVRWVDGEPADRHPVSAPGSAKTLATFLRALHTPASDDAPRNPSRAGSLAETPLEDSDFEILGEHANAARALWAAALTAPAWEGPALWVHSDLHPANVLTHGGALSGVIDFGDACAGDPAVDLAAAWVLLANAEPCVRAYGADDAMIARARGFALVKSLVLLHVGRNGRLGLPGGKPTWEPAGHAALARLLDTPRNLRTGLREAGVTIE